MPASHSFRDGLYFEVRISDLGYGPDRCLPELMQPSLLVVDLGVSDKDNQVAKCESKAAVPCMHEVPGVFPFFVSR